MNLVYEGSVKRLLEKDGAPDSLFFEFTDDYSVFDWGKMPDKISNKGTSLALMGAHFFELLSEPEFFKKLPDELRSTKLNSKWLDERFQTSTYKDLLEDGLQHHFLGLSNGNDRLELNSVKNHLDKPVYLEVQKADVFSPEVKLIENQKLYFYPETIPSSCRRRLVPLEVVFRFGMPQGSSLMKRLTLNPNYFRELGLKNNPKEGEIFERPVIEFFTKLEPTDRHLSLPEALLISKLNSNQFEEMVELTYAIALALLAEFTKCGITLYDGKFEFILVDCDTEKPKLALADSIGPDELRLIYKGQHLSKELIRQYYHGSDWEKACVQAKQLSKEDSSVGFKQRCTDELKQTPKPIDAKAKEQIDMLYPVLANTITGRKLFDGMPDLDQLVDSFNSVFSRLSINSPAK